MRRCKHGLVQSGLIQIRVVGGALRASLRNRCLATHLGFRLDLVAVSENLLRRLFVLFLLLWQRPELVQALLSNDTDWRNSRRGSLCRLRTQTARALRIPVKISSIYFGLFVVPFSRWEGTASILLALLISHIVRLSYAIMHAVQACIAVI